jgi:hypothetical protein
LAHCAITHRPSEQEELSSLLFFKKNGKILARVAAVGMEDGGRGVWDSVTKITKSLV